MTIGYSDGRVYEDEMHAHLDIPAMPTDKEPEPQEPDLSQPKKIYFVRHGETDLNEDDRCRGWSSVGLNPDGRKDAQKAAESLRGTPVEHLVASDLPRAQETGRIISGKLGIPVEYHAGLRTWDTGDWTGQPNSQVSDDIKKYTNETPDERPPGSMESFNEFKNRVLGSVSDILQKHSDKEIGIVSHNMVGRVIHAWSEAGQPEKASEKILRPEFMDKPQWWLDPKLNWDKVTPGKTYDFSKDLPPNLYGGPKYDKLIDQTDKLIKQHNLQPGDLFTTKEPNGPKTYMYTGPGHEKGQDYFLYENQQPTTSPKVS